MTPNYSITLGHCAAWLMRSGNDQNMCPVLQVPLTKLAQPCTLSIAYNVAASYAWSKLCSKLLGHLVYVSIHFCFASELSVLFYKFSRKIGIMN